MWTVEMREAVGRALRVAFMLADVDGDWEEMTRLRDAAAEMDLLDHLADVIRPPMASR